MSNMKHTPEPWKTDRFLRLPIAFPKLSEPVIMVVMCPDDFERAMQCVNACAGIEDPESFMRMTRELINRASRDGSILANSIKGMMMKGGPHETI